LRDVEPGVAARLQRLAPATPFAADARPDPPYLPPGFPDMLLPLDGDARDPDARTYALPDPFAPRRAGPIARRRSARCGSRNGSTGCPSTPTPSPIRACAPPSSRWTG